MSGAGPVDLDRLPTQWLRRRAVAVRELVLRSGSVRRVQRLVHAAEDLGWHPNKSDQMFFEAVDAALSWRTSPVLVIVDKKRAAALSKVLAAHPSRPQVSSVRTTTGPETLHTRLALGGRYDVIIDNTRERSEHADLFRRAFMHLEPGGIYVVRGGAAGGRRLRQLGVEPLADLVARVVAAAQGPPGAAGPADRGANDDFHLGEAVTQVSRHGRHLSVTNGGSALAKLTERQADRWLRARGGSTGSATQRHTRQRFVSLCELSESPSTRAGRMPAGFRVPPIMLREYAGAQSLPGQILVHGNVVLPDSYRHNQQRRLRQRFLEDLAPSFARVGTEQAATPTDLAGEFCYLDSEFRGHFGHAMTEQLARVWAWQETRQRYPDARALMAVNAGRRKLLAFERDLFGAAGIGEADLVLVDRPVTPGRLVAGTPLFANPAYVHPAIAETWAAVGDHLVGSTTGDSGPRRIFCSRRADPSEAAFGPNRRVCRNAPELEAFFVAHGFSIVYPEDYPIAEQARLFREADVVAGYAGSAMFNLVWAGGPKDVILVSSESYTAKNEYLISSVLGHRLSIAWCGAEQSHERGWNIEAFNSAYSFDFGREGRFVQGVFDAL